MKLEDKTVEETPVVAEEIELDESSPHEHLDPEEWDIIEKKMPGDWYYFLEINSVFAW